jgi:secondary thiamine-phosphate synthase enzyme
LNRARRAHDGVAVTQLTVRRISGQSRSPMSVVTSRIELRTRGDAQVVDVTERVQSAIRDSGLRDGIACVFVPGSTGALTTLEYEAGCVADLVRLFDRIAPPGADYEHEKRWHDGNGHSHLRAALLGPSLSLPFTDGEATLGTWQQIVFVDFDNRARTRNLVVQLVGQ